MLAEIASIGTDFFGRLTGVFLHLLGHRLYLCLVIGLLSNIGCYYHLRLIVNCCLAIVALLERLRGVVSHYPRVRISEVALPAVVRLWPQFCTTSFRPTIPLSVLCDLLLADLCFQSGFGLADPLQPLLPEPQLLGQLVAPVASAIERLFFSVDRLGSGQQLLDLSLQSGKLLLHPPVAHRLVLGSISTHLRAI
jgi:hypothetical protein